MLRQRWVYASVFFLLLIDHAIPRLHKDGSEAEGPKSRLPKSVMMVLAVILHNIPEGMAVGVVCAGWLSGQSGIGMTAVVALALGIAIQNFPEGAIVSLPLRSEGVKRSKAFAWGALSGIVEPIGTILTIFLAELFVPLLPYLLGFAAGAMLYVVVEDLIPEMSTGTHSNISTLCFAAGFVMMMALDVALGYTKRVHPKCCNLAILLSAGCLCSVYSQISCSICTPLRR